MPILKRMRYAIETTIVYIIYYFFSLFTLEKASELGGAFVRKIGVYFPINKVARKNLQIAFPEKTNAEREEIIKGMWENLGRVAAEYPHLKDIWKVVELEGIENLNESKTSKNGSLFFSAHTGNWESAALIVQKNGVNISSVYRKPNNQGIEDLLQKSRRYGSTDIIPKGSGGAKKIVSVLKAGGAIGVLMDQKLNEGMAVPFFGKDVMTAKAVAHFALKFDCPVYPAQIERIEGAKFKITIHPKLKIVKTDDYAKDVFNILKDINDTIEQWVRKRPEQWLWIHKRWDKKEYK